MSLLKTLVVSTCLAVMHLATPIAYADQKKENTDRDREIEPKAQTTMDFDSTMIDGKMKAPSGFMLQGRNRQSLTNMVKLRSNFKPQLNDSKAAVKALVK